MWESGKVGTFGLEFTLPNITSFLSGKADRTISFPLNKHARD